MWPSPLKYDGVCFESIHPFADGNGRIGRILNVLYLAQTGLLDTPILYLSSHITRNKDDCCRQLQTVRTDIRNQAEAWEQWVLFMLDAVADTATITLQLVESIRQQKVQSDRNNYFVNVELVQLFSDKT